MMIDKKTLARRYLSALNDELGWGATADDDGDVKFSSPVGGFVWVSNHAPADPEYLRMHTAFRLSGFLKMIGSSLDLGVATDQLELMRTAARVTARAKVAKAIALPDRDLLEFSVEMVAAGPERMPSLDHLAGVLPRMLRMLLAATSSFHEEIVLASLDPGESELNAHDGAVESENPL